MATPSASVKGWGIVVLTVAGVKWFAVFWFVAVEGAMLSTKLTLCLAEYDRLGVVDDPEVSRDPSDELARLWVIGPGKSADVFAD